jgi:hypothetical protein
MLLLDAIRPAAHGLQEEEPDGAAVPGPHGAQKLTLNLAVPAPHCVQGPPEAEM